MKCCQQLLSFMLLLLLLTTAQAKAQLNSAEYFFDTDPGIGNGFAFTGITVSNGISYDSSFINGNIIVPSNLSPGYHILYVRFSDLQNGAKVWSQCEARKFNILSGGKNITAAEYFFDTDPGVGNGTAMIMSGNTDSSSFTGNFNTSGLGAGVHNVYVRAKNAQGHWSQYETRKIFISITGTVITQAEYFYDTDPGVGNGVALSITGNTDSSVFTGNINTNGLSAGFHTLHVRAKKITGEWGQYETKKIHVLTNGVGITKAEYFFDTDPGVGFGTPIVINGDTDSSLFSGSISTAGLLAGYHQVCIRTQSITGTWSVYEVRKLYIQPEGNSIPKAEYFVDTDPGVGNGTAYNLNNIDIESSELNGLLNIDSNISAGNHVLYTRAQDRYGRWGHCDSGLAFHYCKKPTQANISASSFSNCGYADIILSIASGQLNSATNWYWYKDSCQGTFIDSGTSIVVTPLDTTTYFVRGEGGCIQPGTCSSITINANPSATVHLNLFLQGYYNGFNEMQSVLLNQNETINPLLTDSVMIQLHDPSTHLVVAQKMAMLHTDGSVLSNFCPLQGSYDLSIHHRNSIETWSANPILLNNEMTFYNFTNDISKAYGFNQVEVDPGVWAFYSGDINQDENVDLADFTLLELDINNFAFGYQVTDLNGDGSVDLQDVPLLELNSNQFIYSQHP